MIDHLCLKSPGSSAEVYVPIVNAKVVFFFGPFSNLKKWALKKFGIELAESSFACADGATFNLEEDREIPGTILVALNDFFRKWRLEPWYALNILSHEVVHASMMILSNKGIGVGLNEDEMLAYLQGYIIEEIISKTKE